jgi:hypothetical protein
MHPRQVSRLRQAFVAVAAVSALWAAILALTGGFVVHVFGLQITSRNLRNPLWLLTISCAAAWALPMPDRRAVLARGWRRARAWIDSPRPVTRGLRWADPAALIALSFAAFDIVLWAGARPLWLDEQMIALNLRDRAFAELAGPLWLGQTAPLGWLVLQRVSVVFLGTGELALRLVPLLLGIAMLAAAVSFGRRMLTPLGAALFVLLCAVGPWIAHYRMELKHYSADALWGLLIPALAVWAMEPQVGAARGRRAAAWWVAAAAGQWCSYGALLATPGCALALIGREWALTGWRGAWRSSLAGLLWLAAFALHYQLSLQFTVGSTFLRDYWVGGFPPPSAAVVETLGWLAGRLTPLAVNPAGTDWAFGFWTSVVVGLALTGWPGVVMLTLPVSAFGLAGARLVPLSDRLALWALPVLYFGVVRCLECGVGILRRQRPARAARIASAIVSIILVLPVCAGVVTTGWSAYRGGRSPHSKQGLHDRASIEWLLRERQGGSAVVTTHFGTPAIWWYGNVALDGTDAGASLHDGTPIFELSYDPEGRCPGGTLPDALAVQQVLVHFGFPDYPPGLPDLLLDTLSRHGTVLAERRFDVLGHAAVVRMGTSTPRAWPAESAAGSGTLLTGCIRVVRALRW